MIPAGILSNKKEVLPEGLEPLESWTIKDDDFKILNGNTIEYFKGDGSIATSHKVAKPGTPFEFQWSVFPNLKGKGSNVWLSTTTDTGGNLAYLGNYWSNSTSQTAVWFSTTNASSESSVNVGNIGDLLLRYRGDGTKIYREYSLNGGTSWVEVATSYRINHTVDLYFVVEMYDYVSSGIGSRVNDIKQQGLYSFDYIRVGSGSGSLTIDGSLIINPASLPILVTEGWYSELTIINVIADVSSPITIKNEGLVTITGSFWIGDLENVIVSGRHAPGIQYGWKFTNTFRPFHLWRVENATFEGMSFANCDYPIYSEIGYEVNDGTKDTRIVGLKIKHSSFVNTLPIQFGGEFYTGVDNGFVKDLEISYNTFSDGSNAAYAGNVDGYQIHHNIINNLNVGNNDHNGVFHMVGAGDFYSNKLTNYQGNAIRAWAFSRVGGKLDINIYDNICYNTRKYSGFELQGFGDKIVSGVSVMTNCKVYNNTVGTMDTSKDWEGVVVDIYSWLGSIEVNKNLGFDLYKPSGAVNDTNMINGMGSSYTQSGNRYFPLATDAVVDLVEFQSKVTGVGAGEL